MTSTAALELLAEQLEYVTAGYRRLAAENAVLWQAYELSLGNPYQHLNSVVDDDRFAGLKVHEGQRRWSRELSEAQEALREAMDARRAAGISIWSEQDAALATSHARRTRTSIRPPIPAILRRAVHERDAYRCVACGTHLDLRIDHVIPFSKGGPTVLENLQTLCDPHNRLKADRMPEDWAAEIARIQKTRETA